MVALAQCFVQVAFFGPEVPWRGSNGTAQIKGFQPLIAVPGSLQSLKTSPLLFRRV